MKKDLLKRDITATSILMASAGAMIGSGWLFSPLYAAQLAGPASLIAWFLTSVFMIFIALTLCELGTIFPIAGGMSNYPRITHGPLIGFVLAWSSWLSYVVMTPIEVQAVLQYLSVFIPSLTVSVATGKELTHMGYLVAVFIMLALVIINTVSVKFLSESNKFISIWKFFIPAIAIMYLIFSSKGSENLNSGGGFMAMGWHGIFASLSLGGVAFAFAGFQNGLILAGEVKNPQKNIPMSIIGSVIIGFAFYSLLQLAFILALPSHSFTNGWSQLHFSGDAGPLVGLLGILGFSFVAKLLLVDASISPMGTAIVYTAATSRILYGMSASKYLPKALMKLNKSKIPYLTLIVNLIFGLLMFFPFPSWQKMVSFLSSTSILSYAIGPICLISLRKQQPNIKRPFFLPYHRSISTIAFFFCNLMLYWCGWDIIWKLYASVLVGTSIYYITKPLRKIDTKNIGNIKVQENKYNSIWFFVYITSILVISYFGSYGNGREFLFTPYDILIIFVLSIFMLWLSKVSCNSEDISNKFIKEVYSLVG